jgi:uncharacterized protein (DUF433 family)
MEKTYFDRIVINPAIMLGKPVFKGTRIPIDIVLDLIGDGIKEEKILRIYPDLIPEDLKAAIKYASYILGRREFYETA